MGTFKRTPFEIDTTVRNGSKYLNQMQFNGIIQNNNTFDVDQNSLTDALNVYVNEQNTLVSREPLIKDNIEIDYPTKTAQLIDIKETNNVKVFVFKDSEKYTIIAYKNGASDNITDITQYYITIFNQYIICWNNSGAKVIDTNADLKWKSMNDFAEIPVTKITAGSSVTTYERNNLIPNDYKEQYIYKNGIESMLPEPTDNATITGEISTNAGVLEITNLQLEQSYLKYQLIKPLNIVVDKNSQVSFSTNSSGITIIAVASQEFVYLSYDAGQTFIAVKLPGRSVSNEFTIRSLSDDGATFFYLHPREGVYCLSTDELNWELIKVSDADDGFDGTVIGYHLLNKENFCFLTNYSGAVYFYFKGVNMNYASGITRVTNLSSPLSIEYSDGFNYLTRMCKIFYDSVNKRSIALYWSTTNYLVAMVGRPSTQSADSALTSIKNSYTDSRTIEDVDFNSDTRILTISGIKYDADLAWYSKYTTTVNFTDMSGTIVSDDYSQDLTNNPAYQPKENDVYYHFPFKLDTNMYIDAGGRSLIDYSTDTQIYFPTVDGKLGLGTYRYPKISTDGNGKFILYSVSNGQSDFWDFEASWIFTNILTDNDEVTISYTYKSNDSIKSVPTLSYSGSELFLAFDNTLMITKNTKDGENTLFNLPKVYTQSFANNIEAIINISTTELAIFFENGITICSKVTDDLLGYNYNLAKTRLTLGTKFGDSVINTADGASTLYATPRGLAIMNYQAYMATTDQTLQFVSDKIYAIWNKFYLSSENITLVQHGDYIFVYNTSNQYLMLDLRNYSWWKFEIPFNIKKIITDQIDLRVISDKLYKFKHINNNTDKIEDDYVDNQYYDVDNEPIRWMFMSQRLHFNLPNHYKNMKQLVFHMIQSTGHISTFNAQVKLYRNSVNYKDMEVIPFDFNFAVDEFRTFVKRFNYWKINLLQYGVANDDKAAVPARLVCNGIDIKYEIGDEVR